MTIELMTMKEARNVSHYEVEATAGRTLKDVAEELYHRSANHGKTVCFDIGSSVVVVHPGMDNAGQIENFMNHAVQEGHYQHLHSLQGKAICVVNETFMKQAHDLGLYTSWESLQSTAKKGPEAVVDWLKQYVNSDIYRQKPIMVNDLAGWMGNSITTPHDTDNPASQLLVDLKVHAQNLFKSTDIATKEVDVYSIPDELIARIKSFGKPGHEAGGPAGKAAGADTDKTVIKG